MKRIYDMIKALSGIEDQARDALSRIAPYATLDAVDIDGESAMLGFTYRGLTFGLHLFTSVHKNGDAIQKMVVYDDGKPTLVPEEDRDNLQAFLDYTYFNEGVPAISLRLTTGKDRLDPGRLSRGQVAKCRQVETWLAREVAIHAPEVPFSCQELRINDDPGDRYIFCEVTIGTHNFNFYAGKDGSALYERVGGNPGDLAEGELAGPKVFEFSGGDTNAWVLDDFREFLGSII
jgi:hypothetical protein